MKKIFFFLFFLPAYIFGQTTIPYKNPSLPVDERVKDLLSRMTPQEKFWQMFMIPGDLDNADSLQYKNGIFGFQVSAASKGDAAGQMLNYGTNESALALAKKSTRYKNILLNIRGLVFPSSPLMKRCMVWCVKVQQFFRNQ